MNDVSTVAREKETQYRWRPAEVTLSDTPLVLRAVDALFGREEEPQRLAKSWLRFFASQRPTSAGFAAISAWPLRLTIGQGQRGFQDAVTEGASRSSATSISAPAAR